MSFGDLKGDPSDPASAELIKKHYGRPFCVGLSAGNKKTSFSADRGQKIPVGDFRIGYEGALESVSAAQQSGIGASQLSTESTCELFGIKYRILDRAGQSQVLAGDAVLESVPEHAGHVEKFDPAPDDPLSGLGNPWPVFSLGFLA